VERRGGKRFEGSFLNEHQHSFNISSRFCAEVTVVDVGSGFRRDDDRVFWWVIALCFAVVGYAAL
jgi:hypothetical protein